MNTLLMSPHADFVLAVLWAVAAAGVSWYALTVAQQVTYVTLADGRLQERQLPLVFRLLLPLAGNFAPFLRRAALRKPREDASRKLTAAGYEGLLNGDELLAMRILVPLVFGPLWVMAILYLTAQAPGKFGASLQQNRPLFALIGILLLHLYPVAWLRSVLAARHLSMSRSLPFVLDLLTLSVEAGMDFMSALQRTVSQRNLNALGEELLRVVRQIQLGKTRKQALLAMMTRLDHPDISSVFGSLIQADELGVSIGSILRIQANQVRSKRFDRAERLANEAPVKLLFPLIFFIFPSVFLILLGPVVMKLFQQGGL